MTVYFQPGNHTSVSTSRPASLSALPLDSAGNPIHRFLKERVGSHASEKRHRQRRDDQQSRMYLECAEAEVMASLKQCAAAESQRLP